MPSAKVTNIDWKMLAAVASDTLRVLDLSGNDLLENPFPPSDISFPKLTALNLRGTNLDGLMPTSIQNACGGDDQKQFALQSLDLSAEEPGTLPHTVTININLTGFTNLAAFAWHNKSTCPTGFYPTADSPSNPLNSLCGKCPLGTEKLEPGGTREDCISCAGQGLFDFDDDASTKCEASEFKVLEFEHYIPAGKDEAKYAFSKTNNDPLNNDPSRTPSRGPSETKQLYFSKRAGTITNNTDTIAIMSYQTLYADVPVILPPINATKTQPKSSGSIKFTVDGLTDDFFINPDNGAIFGNPSFQKSNFNVTMYAVDSNGARAVVETIEFTVIQQDTLSEFNGPGGKICSHGESVDGNKFDGKFTCNCVGSGYEDDNCSTSITGKHAKIVTGIFFGCILLGCVAWALHQDQLAKNDAHAALDRARQAYGLDNGESPVPNKSVRANIGAAVSTINPGFAGLAIVDLSDLGSGSDVGAGDDYIQVAPAVADADGVERPSMAALRGDQIRTVNRNLASNNVSTDNRNDGAHVESSVLPHDFSSDSSVVSDHTIYSTVADSDPDNISDLDSDALESDEFALTAAALAVHNTNIAPLESKKEPPAQSLQIDSSKFVAPTISLGKSTLAAKGLDVLLGVDPKTYMYVKNKVKVMLKEFAKSGSDEDNYNLNAILAGTYTHPPNEDGSPLTRDAIVGQSKTMDELMACSNVKDAGLERHHVLALRLYTTSSFSSINNPMRQSPPVLPHPFAATLYYISEALSKLREVQGKDAAMRNETLVFWRGMKNMQITDEFLQTGGSEMACMSTTSDQSVAENFAWSKSPLLFKFVSKSFMSHGADISFLSVYPGEKEVLYPPLTYLRPIRMYKKMIGGNVYTVVEVEPVFPK